MYEGLDMDRRYFNPHRCRSCGSPRVCYSRRDLPDGTVWVICNEKDCRGRHQVSTNPIGQGPEESASAPEVSTRQW